MKYLLLFRHAKTEKSSFGQPDHDRQLTADGKKAATFIGQELTKYQRTPHAILCSDAVRTKETCAIAMEAMQFPGTVSYLSDLYTADAEDIAGILANRSEDSIMIIGHNPCMEESLERFGGTYEHMRPGCCVWLRLDIQHWAELAGPVLAEEIHVYRPNDWS